MKKIYLLPVLGLALLCYSFNVLAAAPGDSKARLAAAAEAFAKADWEVAIHEYQALVDQGASGAALYYNLGTAYAHRGDKGRAVAMLLRARRLAPRDGDIRANLNLLAPEAGSQIAVLPIPPLQAVYGWLTLAEWAWLGAGAMTAAGLAAAGFLLLSGTGWVRGGLRRAGWALAALAALGHGAAWMKYHDERMKSRAVITGRDTRPSASPDDSAEVFPFTLAPGTVIETGYSGVTGWVKATYGDKNEVFIRRSEIEPL